MDVKPIRVGPIDIEPSDVGPIDAEPIVLDPLDREPTLLSRSTQSVACSKPIFNNYSPIMTLLFNESDHNEPIFNRYRAYRCRAYRSRPARLLAYQSRSNQYRAY